MLHFLSIFHAKCQETEKKFTHLATKIRQKPHFIHRRKQICTGITPSFQYTCCSFILMPTHFSHMHYLDYSWINWMRKLLLLFLFLIFHCLSCFFLVGFFHCWFFPIFRQIRCSLRVLTEWFDLWVAWGFALHIMISMRCMTICYIRSTCEHICCYFFLIFKHMFASSTKLLLSIWIEWYTTKCVYFAHPISIPWKLILNYTSIQWWEKFIVKERNNEMSFVFFCSMSIIHSVLFFLIWILKKFSTNLFCIRKRTFFFKKKTNTELWWFFSCLNHCHALYIRWKKIILKSTTQNTIIHGIKISNFMLN